MREESSGRTKEHIQKTVLFICHRKYHLFGRGMQIRNWDPTHSIGAVGAVAPHEADADTAATAL
jgi:hypothetical protein